MDGHNSALMSDEPWRLHGLVVFLVALDFSTKFLFPQSIGLFQGCVLSVVVGVSNCASDINLL